VIPLKDRTPAARAQPLLARLVPPIKRRGVRLPAAPLRS
jgi:hypothetical protein